MQRRMRIESALPVLLVATLAGCTDKKPPPKKAEPARKPTRTGGTIEAAKERAAVLSDGKAGVKPIPNITGLEVEVPAGAVPYGVGGAAGFHSRDGSFEFRLIQVDGQALKQTFEQVKKETETFLFKKWIEAASTEDGWVLRYAGPKVNEEGDEIGTRYNFEVRRKVGGKTYKCYGGLDRAAGLDAAVKACLSIKPSS